MIASVETKERPRADEVMRDLDLNLDLSDNISHTNTTENLTEYNAIMMPGAIIEEESSQTSNELK